MTALATGYIAEQCGLRPEPFYLALAYAGLGLGVSILPVKETQGHALHEAATHASGHLTASTELTDHQIFTLTSFREKSLSAASQAGLVNNLNDPAIWGLGQLYTGGLSDRIGRKPLIVSGMLTQAFAIAWMAAVSGFWLWVFGAAALGAGTAMVYPTLLATIGDVAHPSWRARSVGVYRLWRDAGFAVGAVMTGIIADLISIEAAIYAVAALTALSGLVVFIRMYETHARNPANG